METKNQITDYRHIIFFQGDAATGFLDILDAFGEKRTIEALLEYDTQPENCRHTDSSPAGSSDTVLQIDNKYELTWNYKFGTIGLCEITIT